MNKKTFITMMLALVTMTGQAQVKSGLDLCLRDEVTGEWLIGLFDDYAIYDCEYWNYAEVDKDHVVLTKDGQRKEVRLKKNAAIIDGSKHKTSVLTRRGQLHPSCLCPYNKNGGRFCFLHPSSV